MDLTSEWHEGRYVEHTVELNKPGLVKICRGVDPSPGGWPSPSPSSPWPRRRCRPRRPVLGERHQGRTRNRIARAHFGDVFVDRCFDCFNFVVHLAVILNFDSIMAVSSSRRYQARGGIITQLFYLCLIFILWPLVRTMWASLAFFNTFKYSHPNLK